MPSEKRHVVLAILGLGSLAGAVHAEDAWQKTMAVAAFPDVRKAEPAPPVRATAPSEVAEGADLRRVFGLRRSASPATASLPDLLPNPYDSTTNQSAALTARGENAFDRRESATDGDERWSNPYAVARIADHDERWSNPYAVARVADHDERWSNPYGPSRNISADERWSNPYAPSVRR